MKTRFDLEEEILQIDVYGEMLEQLSKDIESGLLVQEDIVRAVLGMSVFVRSHSDKLFNTMKECLSLDEYHKPKNCSFEEFVQYVCKSYEDQDAYIRFGQHLMNTLCDIRPDIHEQLVGQKEDCFYTDVKTGVAWQFIRDKWDEKPKN